MFPFNRIKEKKLSLSTNKLNIVKVPVFNPNVKYLTYLIPFRKDKAFILLNKVINKWLEKVLNNKV